MQSLKYKIAYDHQINGMTFFQLSAKYNLNPYNVQSLAAAQFEFTEPIERLSIQKFRKPEPEINIELIRKEVVKKKKEITKDDKSRKPYKTPRKTVCFGSKDSAYYKDEMSYGEFTHRYNYNKDLIEEYETQTSNKLR